MFRTEEINFILKAIEQAIPIIEKDFFNFNQVLYNQKANDEFVTETDLRVEEILIRYLEKFDSKASFLSEEIGLIDKNPIPFNNELIWVIDPIDGTFNFIHGNPNFGISIALIKKNNNHSETMAGVICLPMLNRTYWAMRGKGAYLIDAFGRERKIKVSSRSKFKELMIGTGESFTRQKRNLVKQINANYLQVRISGSSIVDLSNLACGIYDLVIQDSLKPWDLAAGILLIEEAEGILTNFKGRKATIFDSDIIAFNSSLFNNLTL